MKDLQAGPQPRATTEGWKAVFISLVLTVSTIGCRPGASHSGLIERYKAATCIPVLQDASPIHSREWKTALTLTDRSQVIVAGMQSPGGRISLDYVNSGRSVVAANAGDYIYPADVRVNLGKDLLYVEASGLGGGIWQETWLFDYDLRSQKLLRREKVTENGLPAWCQAANIDQ